MSSRSLSVRQRLPQSHSPMSSCPISTKPSMPSPPWGPGRGHQAPEPRAPFPAAQTLAEECLEAGPGGQGQPGQAKADLHGLHSVETVRRHVLAH